MINKKRRIISLTGPVDHNMYEKVVVACATFQSTARVKVIINTPGGYLHDAFAIYDLLRLNFPKLTMICSGMVMSAGTVIISAADRVYTLPSTEFMIHYGENSANSAAEARANARAIKMMKEIIKKRVKVKPDRVNEWFEKETFMSASQALKVGLVDGIIGAKNE